MSAAARAWATGHVPGATWEPVRERPWATVYRSGDVWLKVAGADTRFEAGLYAVLAPAVPDGLLQPLALDVEHGWMLLPDGGPSVRVAGADPALALRGYAALQQAASAHVDALVAAGVPDMRPAIMPRRFDEAVAALDVRGATGFRDTFAELCAELAASPVAATVDHNDLHTQNMLASGRFYDWGDAVVAHPFASLLMVEQMAGDDFPRQRDAYLEAFGPPAQLRATAALACRVGLAARALTWLRASAGDPRWRAAAADTLRSLLG